MNKSEFKESIVFNSVPAIKKFNKDRTNYWQHFYGMEIEFKKPQFNLDKFDLMNFDCDQRSAVHFIYTLCHSKKNRMLVETTWFSKYDKKLFDYQKQIEQWIWDLMCLKKSDYKKLSIEKKEQYLFFLFIKKNKKKFHKYWNSWWYDKS